MGRLDQGAVHPGEQGKAEKERQAGAPARRRQRNHAKSGGRQARNVYSLSLLIQGTDQTVNFCYLLCLPALQRHIKMI